MEQAATTEETIIAGAALRVEYQPVVLLADHSLVGFEALSRLRAGGITVMPDDFIAEVTSTGQIAELTDAVLRQTPADVADHFPDLTVGINISVLQITDEQWLDDALNRSFALPRHQIVWEVTETEGAPSSQVADAIERITAAGFVTAMDDFDSGFSSMARLASAKFGALKIDRELIAEVAVSRRHRFAVSAIVTLAAQLGTEVIAEGIETASQAEVLGDLGCRFGQGWFFGRAADIGSFRRDQFAIAS